MTAGENSRAINHHINEFLGKSSNIKNKLDETLALNFAQDLKRHIMGKDKQEKVNSIVVLAKLLDISPPSDGLTPIFDEALFTSLYSIVSVNMSSETYKSIIKISVIFVSGAVTLSRSPTTFDPMIFAIYKNLQLFDVITTKLYSQDLRIVSHSLDLVSKLIFRALEQKSNEIAVIISRLREIGFLAAVTTISEDRRLESEISRHIQDLIRALNKLNIFLSDTTFDLTLNPHKVLLKDLLSILEKSLNDNGKPANSDDYKRAGFTENPSTQILHNFSLLNAIDLLIFLKDSNMSFKKTFYEQLMFAHEKSAFPVSRSALAMTSLLLSVFNSTSYAKLRNHIFSWDSLYYHGMTNCLRIWQAAKAEEGDFETIVNLVSVLYEFIDSKIQEESYIEDILDSIGNLSYEELRKLQLNKIKSDHYKTWSVETDKFDHQLKEEVFEFVCEQRVLQLLKGSWVYSENPVEANNSGRKPKMYFIIMSPNRQFIRYKEYKFKTSNTPTIDTKDGYSIELSSIMEFDSTKIRQDSGIPANSRLINIVSRASFEKISLIGKNSRNLFTFYTDTKETSYVWLDGLKMLTNNASLSADTAAQIKMLIDLRKNVQLLSLSENDGNQKPITEEEEIYDINTLESIATDFYYN